MNDRLTSKRIPKLVAESKFTHSTYPNNRRNPTKNTARNFNTCFAMEFELHKGYDDGRSFLFKKLGECVNGGRKVIRCQKTSAWRYDVTFFGN